MSLESDGRTRIQRVSASSFLFSRRHKQTRGNISAETTTQSQRGSDGSGSQTHLLFHHVERQDSCRVSRTGLRTRTLQDSSSGSEQKLNRTQTSTVIESSLSGSCPLRPKQDEHPLLPHPLVPCSHLVIKLKLNKKVLPDVSVLKCLGPFEVMDGDRPVDSDGINNK